MEISPEEWTDLAWKAVRSSKKSGFQGVELEDMFQCAMIGIMLAAKNYDNEREFPAYAHWYMHREINNLVYKRTSGTHTPRIDEDYLEDLEEEGVVMDDLVYYDYIDEEEYVDEFLSSIPLDYKDKRFLFNLIEYGDADATELYLLETGNSRQRANQKKREIREVSQKHMRRLQDDG